MENLIDSLFNSMNLKKNLFRFIKIIIIMIITLKIARLSNVKICIKSFKKIYRFNLNFCVCVSDKISCL